MVLKKINKFRWNKKVVCTLQIKIVEFRHIHSEIPATHRQDRCCFCFVSPRQQTLLHRKKSHLIHFFVLLWLVSCVENSARWLRRTVQAKVDRTLWYQDKEPRICIKRCPRKTNIDVQLLFHVAVCNSHYDLIEIFT